MAGEGASADALPVFLVAYSMKSLIRSHSPLALFSLAMVALMCVLPFLVPIHLFPMTSFYGEWLAAALGLGASLLLLRPKSWQPFQFPLVALVPLGLIMVLGIQVWAGLAVYWQQHFLVGLYLLWAALLVVLGAELRREYGLEKLVGALAWALILGGVLVFVVDLLQMLGWQGSWLIAIHLDGHGYSANMGQVNHAANYLGLALASLLYLAATHRLPKFMAPVIALGLLFALALTGQRMGWIYVTMLSLGSWLVGRKTSPVAWRTLWLIPAFIALQLLIPLLPVAEGLVMPAEKVVNSMQGGSIRLELARQAWHIFMAHPWLGAGWGQFAWQDFLLAEQFPNHFGRHTNAHNLVLQLLAETGLAGASILLIGAAAWLNGVLRAARTHEYWCLLALISVLGVHSLLEFPFWYAYFLGLGALFLGMMDERPALAKLELGPLLVAGFALFGALSLFNLAQHYPRLEQWYQTKSRKAIAQQIDAVPEMRKRSLLAPYLDFMLLRVLPDTPEFQAFRLEYSSRLIRFLPDAKDVYEHATILAKAGRMAEAKHHLRLALLRHPGRANGYAVKLLRSNDPALISLVQMALSFDLERNPPQGLNLKQLLPKPQPGAGQE